MTLIFIVLPLALLITAGAIVGFIWATRSGQFDDVDTPAVRMLLDDATASPNTDATQREDEQSRSR